MSKDHQVCTLRKPNLKLNLSVIVTHEMHTGAVWSNAVKVPNHSNKSSKQPQYDVLLNSFWMDNYLPFPMPENVTLSLLSHFHHSCCCFSLKNTDQKNLCRKVWRSKWQEQEELNQCISFYIVVLLSCRLDGDNITQKRCQGPCSSAPWSCEFTSIMYKLSRVELGGQSVLTIRRSSGCVTCLFPSHLVSPD